MHITEFMDNQSVNQESNELNPEPKWFELSPSLVGALTGVVVVLLLSLFYRIIGFISLAIGFLYPGYFVLEKIDSLNIDMSALSNSLILYGASSLPPAIIGALIFSDKPLSRISGVILLIIYSISWIYFSFFIGMLD